MAGLLTGLGEPGSPVPQREFTRTPAGVHPWGVGSSPVDKREFTRRQAGVHPSLAKWLPNGGQIRGKSGANPGQIRGKCGRKCAHAARSNAAVRNAADATLYSATVSAANRSAAAPVR